MWDDVMWCDDEVLLYVPVHVAMSVIQILRVNFFWRPLTKSSSLAVPLLCTTKYTPHYKLRLRIKNGYIIQNTSTYYKELHCATTSTKCYKTILQSMTTMLQRPKDMKRPLQCTEQPSICKTHWNYGDLLWQQPPWHVHSSARSNPYEAKHNETTGIKVLLLATGYWLLPLQTGCRNCKLATSSRLLPLATATASGYCYWAGYWLLGTATCLV